ncbi:MAG: hypothetical protein ACYC5A_10980 [Thermoleophilia bacterium]
MKLRTRLFCGVVVALLALSATTVGIGCGEEQQAETVTKKETKTVTKKDKTTRKTGTAPKTAPATPTPAPNPPAPTPAPGGGVANNQAADQADMVALIQSDPYYGYGDTYEVMAYDPYNSSGTVLIATYYVNYTQFTEVYMLKDQYGWYADGDYTYTIP